MFEWEPNPVIIPHLRGGCLQSLDSGPSTAKDTSDPHLVDTTGEAGELSPDMAVAFDDKGAVKCNPRSPVAPRYTGLTTMFPILSTFACPQCTYVAKGRAELKYAIAIFLKSISAMLW
jgi:hypothetical protein